MLQKGLNLLEVFTMKIVSGISFVFVFRCCSWLLPFVTTHTCLSLFPRDLTSFRLTSHITPNFLFYIPPACNTWAFMYVPGVLRGTFELLHKSESYVKCFRQHRVSHQRQLRSVNRRPKQPCTISFNHLLTHHYIYRASSTCQRANMGNNAHQLLLNSVKWYVTLEIIVSIITY